MSFSGKYLGIFTKFSDTGLANSQMKLDILLGNLRTNVPQNLLKGVAVRKPIVYGVLSVNVTCQDSDYHYMFHASNSCAWIATALYGLLSISKIKKY